jgi:hypothetical protein
MYSPPHWSKSAVRQQASDLWHVKALRTVNNITKMIKVVITIIIIITTIIKNSSNNNDNNNNNSDINHDNNSNNNNDNKIINNNKYVFPVRRRGVHLDHHQIDREISPNSNMDT